MDEPKGEEVSVCRISESTVTHNESVVGETLEESVECGGQIEGSFSRNLAGEDGGACNGKDILVEVLGSDVYIDGVCTRGSENELNDGVCCKGSGDVEGDLDKGVSPLDAAARVGNDVKGTGVCDSMTIVSNISAETEVPALDEVGLEHMSAREVGVLDDKVTNSGSDNALGLSEVGSISGENVQEGWVKEYNQQDRNFANYGATEGQHDLTLKSVDGQKKIINGKGDKILEEEACIHNKVESVEPNVIDEKLNSVGGQPMEIDEVPVDKALLKSEEKQCIRHEKSIDKKRFADTSQVSSDTGQGMEVDEDCYAEGFAIHAKIQKPEAVDVSTNRDAQVYDIGQISLIDSGGTVNVNHEVAGHALYEQVHPQKSQEFLEKDMGGDLALKDSDSRKEMEVSENVSDAEQVNLHKGQEIEVGFQQEKMEIANHTADSQGTLVSFSVGEQNIEANSISSIVEKDMQNADRSYFAPMGAEEEEFNDNATLSANDPKLKFLKCVDQNVTSDVAKVESNDKQSIEGEAGFSEQANLYEGLVLEGEEFNDAEQQIITDEKVMRRAAMKPGNGRFYEASYQLPSEKEGGFSVSDMVWGKVRSHPWWPGQIFDPSNASEKALKHYKKDCFLVAYFGDRTFAWNEEPQLKPFRTNFSSIEKQSNSEAFQNAVDCALDEVSRRVEFGLACPCIPKDTYDKIKVQTVENTGIRQELYFRHRVDESFSASSFLPGELIEYLKSLSQVPTGGSDRLELVIAKAQLLAFYRSKGYSYLPELQHCGGLDNDMDMLILDAEKNLSEVNEHTTPLNKNDDQDSAGLRILRSQNSSRHKRKHNLKDGLYPKKKEKSLSELMVGSPDSPDGDYWSDEKAADSLVSPTLSKKRRTVDHFAEESGVHDGRKTISLAKVSNSTKQSFKIGECIRRVASQLTSSTSINRSQKPDGSIDGLSGDVFDEFFQHVEAQRSSSIVQTEYSSLDDLLSLLQWVAQDPLGAYSFLNVIVSFFSDFRNSIVDGNYTPTNKVGAKRKKLPVAGSPETFEFDDMSDTYWTDRVIQNGSEEQPSRKSRKRDYQPVSADPEKPLQVSRRSYSRKRYSDGNHTDAPEKPSGYIDEKSPAELVMNFAELDSVPSETNLNKMFRRFGPLKESETEVDRLSSRARVVFKKSADAEIAFSSAKKFNIFGPLLVNYQLNYSPSALFKASSIATTQDQEMHLDLSNFEANMG